MGHARGLFLLLLLWILGDQLARIDSATTALFGLSVLLIANVLTWKDILREEGAWDTLVWFAALVMMASFLNELGLIPWFTKSAQGMVGGVNWGVAFLILCLLYFYSHYLFASQTAHVSSMYAAFLSVSVAVGTPPLLAALVRYGLPIELLTGLVAARRFDLYDDPMRTLAEFNAYACATSSALIELAARILAREEMPGLGPLAFHAGLGYAIAGLLQAFPVHAARGQLYLPLEVLERHGVGQEFAAKPATGQLRDALAEMRGHARQHLAQAGRLADGMPVAGLPALLPVALAGPALDRMERADYDPLAAVEPAQWRRQWLLWRAARRPARIFL